MNTFRRRLWVGLLLAIVVIFTIYQYIYPRFSSPPQSKPNPIIEDQVYEYYILIDEETGAVLGHVSSLKVTTGDEYLSENNNRYVVTKVEENRAYMRSFGPAEGGQDKGNFKDKTN